MLQFIKDIFTSKGDYLPQKFGCVYQIFCVNTLQKMGGDLDKAYQVSNWSKPIGKKGKGARIIDVYWPVLLHNILSFGTPKPDVELLAILKKAEQTLQLIDNPWAKVLITCATDGVLAEQYIDGLDMLDKNKLSIARQDWEKHSADIANSIRVWFENKKEEMFYVN